LARFEIYSGQIWEAPPDEFEVQVQDRLCIL